MRLQPVAYQYPLLGNQGGTDANWLVVECRVRCADGRGWSFLEPCLLTDEAQTLAEWLDARAAGRAAPSLSFMEPAIAFDAHSDHGVTLTFELEGLPPWQRGGEAEFDGWALRLDLDQHTLGTAAGSWRVECAAFPPR